jgi:hypothetical protein
VPWFAVLDHLPLRTRVGLLVALVTGLSVMLVTISAFVIVRANILTSARTCAARSARSDPLTRRVMCGIDPASEHT